MSDVYTKHELLGEIRVLTDQHYDGNVPESVKTLLPKIVYSGLSGVELRDPWDEYAGIVYIIGEITSQSIGEDGGTLDQMFRLNYSFPKEKPLTLFISSLGGDQDAGLAIIGAIDTIRRTGRKVVAYIAGWAYSAAFDIVQHCDTRVAEATSSLMFHETQYSMDGSTTARSRGAAAEKKQARLIADVISKRTGKPSDFYAKKIAAEDWYLTAKEALEEGLIDQILPLPELPKANIALEPKKPRQRKQSALVDPNPPATE